MVVTTATMTTAMREAIKPYSIAVTPRQSPQNLESAAGKDVALRRIHSGNN